MQNRTGNRRPTVGLKKDCCIAHQPKRVNESGREDKGPWEAQGKTTGLSAKSQSDDADWHAISEPDVPVAEDKQGGKDQERSIEISTNPTVAKDQDCVGVGPQNDCKNTTGPCSMYATLQGNQWICLGLWLACQEGHRQGQGRGLRQNHQFHAPRVGGDVKCFVFKKFTFMAFFF